MFKKNIWFRHRRVQTLQFDHIKGRKEATKSRGKSKQKEEVNANNTEGMSRIKLQNFPEIAVITEENTHNNLLLSAV